MAAYIIADIYVKDEELFSQTYDRVKETIAGHGGKYIVRGGDCH